MQKKKEKRKILYIRNIYKTNIIQFRKMFSQEVSVIFDVHIPFPDFFSQAKFTFLSLSLSKLVEALF